MTTKSPTTPAPAKHQALLADIKDLRHKRDCIATQLGDLHLELIEAMTHALRMGATLKSIAENSGYSPTEVQRLTNVGATLERLNIEINTDP